MKKSNKLFTVYIGPGSKLDGTFSFEGVGRIDGTFLGDVNSKDKLVIGETGKIIGNVNVSEIIVYGTIEGNIIAEKTTMYNTGNIKGDLNTDTLVTQAGAFIDGKLSMRQKGKISNIDSAKSVKSVKAV